MRRPYLNQQLRRLVAERANYACKYCLIHEQNTVLGCAVDHMIPANNWAQVAPILPRRRTFLSELYNTQWTYA